MWTLSLNDILAAKEELTGRRAAVKARYEKDLQGIEDDLRNIMALESAADLFLKSHKQEDAMTELEDEPAAFAELESVVPTSAGEAVADFVPDKFASEAEAEVAQPSDAKPVDLSLERKINRWRIR